MSPSTTGRVLSFARDAELISLVPLTPCPLPSLHQSTKTDSKMSDTGPTGSSSLAKNGSAKEAAPVDDDNTGEIAGHGETNRVLGGYKATLKNPNVSEEAKEHAREVLEEHGMEVKE